MVPALIMKERTRSHVDQHTLRSGSVISWKLHDKRGRIASKWLHFFQDNTGANDSGNADEVGHWSHPPGIPEQRAGYQSNNRKFGAARDKGGGHNGHFAVAVVFDRTGGHNARNAAAGADENRNKAIARKAKLAKNPIHHKGDSGHISAIFQQGQQEEQNNNLGKESNYRPHAADDAFQNKGLEPIRSIHRGEPAFHSRRDNISE